jgi:hypothetical protein
LTTAASDDYSLTDDAFLDQRLRIGSVGGESFRRKSIPESGGVAEWSKAPVLKTGLPKGNGGSNPFSSALHDWRFVAHGCTQRQFRRFSGSLLLDRVLVAFLCRAYREAGRLKRPFGLWSQVARRQRGIGRQIFPALRQVAARNRVPLNGRSSQSSKKQYCRIAQWLAPPPPIRHTEYSKSSRCW